MENKTPAAYSQKKWIRATFAGWVAGAVMIIVTSGIFDAVGLEGFQFYIGISMGGSIGFFQWRSVHTSVSFSTGWIWSSLAGMGIPFLIIDLLSKFGGLSLGSYYLPASIFTGGMLTGLLQHTVLKNRYAGVLRWIVVCWIGWIAASLTIFAIDFVTVNVRNLAGFFINLTLIFSGGPVLGWVTGKTLVIILSSPVTQEQTDK